MSFSSRFTGSLFRGRLTVLTIWVSLLLPVVSTADIPVETFFKNPERAQMSLSADGRYIAALAPFNGRMNVFVVDTKEVSGKWITGFKDENTASVTWANDERLLITLDGSGNPALATALFSAKVDGSEFRSIVEPFSGGSVFRYTRLLDLLPDNPNEILVVSNERLSEFPDVYRMRVNRPGKRMVERNPGDITNWITDRNGEVRLGSARSKDGMTTSIRLREVGKKEWLTIATSNLADPGWSPIGFDTDNDTLIVLSDHESDFTGLYRYDWRNSRFIEKLWASDTADVGGVIYSGKRDRIVGVNFEGEKPGVHWFDPTYAELQRELDLAFPGELVTFFPAGRTGAGPSDRDERQFIVRTTSSKSPVSFHLLDSKSFQMTLLSKSRPWIDPDQMAEMQPIAFTARDGRRIPGYLTLPPTGPKTNLPLILHPHGGPWARDSYRFNPEVQFLASRGFAVLQVNYRGSVGFGREFMMASQKQFGEAMQDDLIDGVKWAISEGIADPARVGVYGASYGGYATMVALTETPEMFQWGINYVGVVDLIEHINWYKKIERDFGYHYWSFMVGNPETDTKLLADNSPMNFLDRIKVPLFIIHGQTDFNVSIDQSLTLMKALDAKGIPYRSNIKKNEGHGFTKEENVLELYQQFDEFLAPFRTR